MLHRTPWCTRRCALLYSRIAPLHALSRTLFSLRVNAFAHRTDKADTTHLASTLIQLLEPRQAYQIHKWIYNESCERTQCCCCCCCRWKDAPNRSGFSFSTYNFRQFIHWRWHLCTFVRSFDRLQCTMRRSEWESDAVQHEFGGDKCIFYCEIYSRLCHY